MEIQNRDIALNIERETNLQPGTFGYPQVTPVMEVGSKFSNYFYAYENDNCGVGGGIIQTLYTNINKDRRFFITSLGITASKTAVATATYVKIHIYNLAGQDFYVGIPFISGLAMTTPAVFNINFPFPIEIMKDTTVDLVTDGVTAFSLAVKAFIAGIELKR